MNESADGNVGTDPNTWTLAEASRAIAAGTLTSEALVRSCLDRIAEREETVGAWVYLDAEAALATARARDRETPRGPLHGIPFGVKDVIDTADMPTEHGSPIYAGARPAQDAPAVALSRGAGAVVLGKTVTTEFAAVRVAPKTRNPANPGHTPGASSSGSAAAVADAMVPFAFATQTTGSLIRPGAYCGVVGVKPSRCLVNRAGMKQLSDFMDTVGIYARTVEDAALVLEVVADLPLPDFGSMTASPPGSTPKIRPRIALCRTTAWNRARPETAALFDGLAESLARAGAVVRELDLPPDFEGIDDAQEAIYCFESWRALAYERLNHSDKISAALAERLEQCGRVTRPDYEAAKAHALRCRGIFADLLGAGEVVIAPAAEGEAESIANGTGHPIFNLIWNVLHVPCVTVPAGTGPRALPLGVQIVAPCGADRLALAAAEWVRCALLRR